MAESPHTYHPPFVSVIVPMRNEARFIGQCLDTLLAQDYPADQFEIIVADGMSTDGSRDIVQDYVAREPRVRMIDNPEHYVPTALNRAIRASKGRYVIRADAHADYALDYVRQCVTYLEKTGAENVGGPIVTYPGADTLTANCIAALTSHPIVVGGSRFRTSMKEEYADGAIFGAWPRELFDRIGYFNEALIRHQDNEFNSRIMRHGGKIFKTPKIRIRYFNQATFRGLWRQAFRNGKWHVLSLIGNPSSFKFRYFAPFGFDCWLLGFGLLSLWKSVLLWPLVVALGLYGCIVVLVTGQIARSHGPAVASLVPLGMFSYHVWYGLGTFLGIVRFGILGNDYRRRAREGSRPPTTAPSASP